MTDEQCYEILKLNFGATEEEIKKQHKILSRVWHPDKYAKDPPAQLIAEDELKKLNNAREQLLKSVNNSNYKQPYNSQTPKVQYSKSDTTPTKRKSSRLGIVALGILGIFVAICGSSIYFGSGFLGSGFFGSDNTSSGGDLRFNDSDKAEIVNERRTASKLKEMTLTDKSLRFDWRDKIKGNSYSAYMDIKNITLESYSNKELRLKFSICNAAGEELKIGSVKFWFTPSSSQNTINWKPSSGQILLKNGECKLYESWSEKTDYILDKLSGRLHAEISNEQNSIDLSERSIEDLRKNPIIIRDGNSNK